MVKQQRAAAPPERIWRWALLAAALALVPYLNSLPGILFWDSEVLILKNVFLRSFSHLPEIWTTSVTAGGGEPNNYYRPLPVTLLLLQYQLWGPKAVGYHAVALAIHALNAGLLFLLARRLLGGLLGGRWAALWCALFFAFHPVQNETVNYVDHFEGTLACSFGLAAVLTWLSGRRYVSASMFALSLLCKEEGAVFLPILAMHELLSAESRRDLIARWLRLWPHALVFGIYALLRMTVFDFLDLPFGQFSAQQGAYAPLGLRLLTFAKALATYLRLLVWPSGLHFDRDMAPASGWGDAAAWACAALCAAVLAGLWRLAKGDFAARFGLAWFACGLLPYSGLLAFNNILAEHFLYIPSAGLLLALVSLLRGALTSPGAVPAFAALILAAFCAVNWRRNADWQDPARLYATTLQGNPKSFRAANNLGVEHFRSGRFPEAQAAFMAALRAKPDYAPALNNVGAVAEHFARYKEALEWYGRSAQADPTYYLARKNLAVLNLRGGRLKEAREHAEALARLYPGEPEAAEILRLTRSAK
jgi:tetratricopeptide (TPR) repeat protein